MFLNCDNGLISAIFLRNLCVQKTQPVRNYRPVCAYIHHFNGQMFPSDEWVSDMGFTAHQHKKAI